MQLNEVKPYKHKMKIEILICFLVGSLIFAPGLSANPDLPELKFTDYTVENGLSYNSVLSICQDASGKTPVELIKTMRMKRACELMKETDLSIADIAEQTGFQTPGYFITVFKNHFGETPGHYASRVRQQ